MLVNHPSNPLISVIIPCFNAEDFVETAVRSIMQQTYSYLEIIVINDCSTDSTGEILKKLASEDSRIVYIENEKNLKLPKSLNKAIKLSKGSYIARMDSDDISLPERIEKQINFLLENPDIDILGSNLQHIDEEGKISNYRSYYPNHHKAITHKLMWKSTLCHPSILAKKSFFSDLKGFNEDLAYAEDYDLWIRGYLSNKKFANLPDILVKYRVHAQQMTSLNYSKKHAKIIRKFLFNYFLKTKNIYFLFGCLIQTRFMYYLIHSTATFRLKFKIMDLS